MIIGGLGEALQVVSWGETVQALAALFGQHVSSWVLGVLAAATIAAPVVDRFVIRRKRLHYRVLYNSKIGLSPIELHDGEVPPADPQLIRIARLVDRMSIVIIRIRNTGSFDIEADDFAEDLSFTFGKRIVWDARISEAPTKTIRQRIRNNLVFFTDGQETGYAPNPPSLGTLRERLGQRLANWVAAQPTAAIEIGPQWHGVRLSELSLQRGQKFKLVVVLREPDDESATTDDSTSKEIGFAGRIANGRIKDEKQQRGVAWPLAVTGIGALLTVALVTTLITGIFRQDSDVVCATGSLRIEGSSAFAPIMSNVATAYSQACGGADVIAQPTGSLDGVRALSAPGSQNDLAVLSDGPALEPSPDLVAQPLALVVYGVVVNDSAGIDRLTTEQLHGIFAGRFRDWNQLRDGASLPIRIVGRGQESGTRQVFETRVLQGSEGLLSSDSCEAPERMPQAQTTRCERSSTAQVVDEIATTPGAIGYTDTPAANIAVAQGKPVKIAQLDGRYPDISSAHQGYRFWTIEYLYTKGFPANDSVLKHFIDYLRSDTARAELRDAGYTPCIERTGLPHPLCQG
ncbi:PstS family phosphate ABC transporter substrate-binding protein [Saccharopolyspora spinosa]|uniref:PstS family phosphate ABC transporter substrate-binding protein n=1 Tax=Saccharopolyspora spinosa TaxID=60894 RepID=UPI000237AFD0|nr:substrate-binding domain-containing protein [Saccharopolyspora spinosa]